MLQKFRFLSSPPSSVLAFTAIRAGTVIPLINGNVWEQETTDAQKCQRFLNFFEIVLKLR